PPASAPSITSASMPIRINLRPMMADGAKPMVFPPYALTVATCSDFGTPPANTTCDTLCFLHTSTNSSICGCITIRFTPNGLSVSSLVATISLSSNSGDIELQAMTPNAPLLLIADTRLRSDTQLIAPPIIAYLLPSNSQ